MNQDFEKFGTIGVLLGGISSEREISLKSGEAVLKALREEGYLTEVLDINSSDERAIKDIVIKAKIDLAFIVLHGKFGEDGRIQQILEDLDVPYTGSGIKASQIAINKVTTQKILKKNGVSVPNYVNLRAQEDAGLDRILGALKSFPLVVKPATEGSSIGIRMVDDQTQLSEAIDAVFEIDDEAIIEEYINGRELTVGILGDKALPVVEICPQESFFNFHAKYTKGKTEYIVPAQLDDCVKEGISQEALRAHLLLGCSDFSRVDFILGKNNQFYLLEINTIPGFTATSLLPKAAREEGIEFNQLCSTLVDFAYAKKKEERKNTVTI